MTTTKKNARGVTVVFVLLSLISLIGLTALGVDAGLIYAARGGLQTASDAAALAGVRALPSCNASAVDRSGAVAAAQLAVSANPVLGRALVADASDVTLGRAVGASRTFTAGNNDPDSVKVVVHEDSVRNGPLPLTIGAVLGRGSAQLDAAGIATRDRHVVGFAEPAGHKSKVLPFAAAASAFGAVGTAAQLFDGSTGPGNFGLLSLGAGGFILGQVSDPTIVAQITDGYAGTLQLDPSGGTRAGGRTGSLGGSIATALQSRVGDVVIVAVYQSPPTGNGANLVYTVTGFASLRIDSVQVTGKQSARGIFGTVVAVTDDAAITDANAPENCLISKIQLTL